LRPVSNPARAKRERRKRNSASSRNARGAAPSVSRLAVLLKSLLLSCPYPDAF
jgi:hypothetical protein